MKANPLIDSFDLCLNLFYILSSFKRVDVVLILQHEFEAYVTLLKTNFTSI